MADVSISQLTRGIPSGSDILPYSTGSNTLGVPVSAIFQTVSDNLYINTSPISIPGKGIVLSSNDSAGTSIFLNNQTINKSWRIVSTGSDNTGGGSRFGIVNHTDDANNYKLVILSGGEVGIGTGSPSTKLEVNGTIKATGLQVPGTVLQVVQAYKTDEQSLAAVTANTYYDVSGLSCNIIPKVSNSKILISASVYVDGATGLGVGARLLRNNNPVGNSSSGQSTNRNFGAAWLYGGAFTPAVIPTQFLDTPSYTLGESLTYKVQVQLLYYNNRTIYINRSIDGLIGLVSYITLTEIAG